MEQVDRILDLIEKLKHEVEVLNQEKHNLEKQNKELLSALSQFTSCLKVECKNRKRRKDD